jgi:hypothetical protein
MAKYKVAVLRVQGINKITYKAGDIVMDENFPKGVAAELVKGGFLVEYTESTPTETGKSKTGKSKVSESTSTEPGKDINTQNPA